MRRMIILVTVAVVMAAMMVTAALPALAAPPGVEKFKFYECTSGTTTVVVNQDEAKALKDQGYHCTRFMGK